MPEPPSNKSFSRRVLFAALAAVPAAAASAALKRAKAVDPFFGLARLAKAGQARLCAGEKVRMV